MGRVVVLYLFCRLLFLNWEVKLVVWKLKWFYGRPSAEEDPNIFLLMRPLPGRYVTLCSFVYCDALERVATYFKMLAAVAVVRMYYLNVVSISTYSNKENRMAGKNEKWSDEIRPTVDVDVQWVRIANKLQVYLIFL